MQIIRKTRTAASIILAGVMALSLTACAGKTSGSAADSAAPASASAASATPSSTKYTDTITVVWYPNESASDYDASRKQFEDLISKATGKKVSEKLTTDYNIAIEALASGQAQIGAVMGALGFIQAQKESSSVLPLFVNSDKNGKLDDAVYYSWLAVNKADAGSYQTNGSYSIDNIKGKRISFVSNSSTSGFLFPTSSIIAHFTSSKLTQDDLAEGGSGKFFSEVLFGGSHQGSAVNLLTGKADVAAFCDTELVNYATAESGDSKEAGSVWKINADATAPFDTVQGKEFTIIQALPVLNGPTAYNAETLSPEDVKAIQALFTSDTVTNDKLIFVPADSTAKGFYKQSSSKQFLVVENSWYDAIRDMLK
jgi:phosphonate transport system substrate-binding protein